jgi:hypothetical protein
MPIDEYDMRARLFPALLISFPVLAFVYGVIPSARGFWGGVSGSILEAAVLFALMRIGRDRGARVQDRLYHQWGAKPTTIMLRHRDDLLDIHTKERYKQTLARLSGLAFPSEAEERANPGEADELYDSAIRALLEQRRGKIYRMVFNENCNYGFVRNLVGLKPIGLGIVLLTLAVDSVLYMRAPADPKGLLVSALVSLLTGLILILMTESSVRRTGDAYALALLRTCEVSRSRSRTL